MALAGCLTVGLCTAWGQASESNHVWTLDRCLEHALEHNLQLQQAELDVVRGELNEQSAKGAFLPNLNASSSYGVNIGQRIDPFTNQFASDAVQSSNYGVSSGLTLFNGFQNHLNLRRARLGMEIAHTGLEIARNNVALNLASAYLNVLFQKEFLSIAQLNVEATERQAKRVQTLVDAGAAAEGDLVDVMAQLAADESAVVAADNAVGMAKLVLSQLLQLSGEDASQMTVSAPPNNLLETTALPVSAEVAVAFATGSFPDMKAASLRVTDAYLGLDLAKAQRMPRITGSYSVGSGFSQNRLTALTEPVYQTFNIDTQEGIYLPFPIQIEEGVYETMSFQDQFTNNLNQSIFFSLSIPIFNNFGIQNNISRAEVDVLSAQLAREQTEQALTQTVEQAWADARAAQRTFEANERALEAAERAMTNGEARFEAGAISALAYADARTRLDNARINSLRAQYDFVFKAKIVDFYLGRPLSL